MAKKYYWLKLKENFFEREEIKVIECMPNGIKYINFYLKLLLKSVSTEGTLKFRGVIPYTPEMLGTITNTDVDTVKVATKLFADLGLMELWDDGTLFMVETQNMIGKEGDSAERMRRLRAKKTNEKQLPSQCDDDVMKSDTEIEIDIEKDIYKEKEKKIELDIEKEADNKSKDNEIAERIWKIYPKKVGKAKAMKKIPKIVKEIGEDKLIRAINSYKQTIKGKDMQYVLQGDTFFNGRYIDYLDVNMKENNYNTFNYKPKIEKVDNVEEMF